MYLVWHGFVSQLSGRFSFGLTRVLSRHVLTGSYHNYFRIFDVESLSDVVLQADKSAFKAKKIGGPLPGNKLGAKNGARGLRDAMQMETLDFNKKILHASWHPRENTIAVCFTSCFQCGWIAGTYPAPSDRCNEQLVLIQRCMMSVVTLVESIVQLCRRHLLLTFRSSCRRLFVSSILQYIPRSLLFTFLALGTLYTAAIAHCPLFRLFQLKTSFSPYTVFKRHTPHFWTLALVIFWFRSPLLYSPRLPHPSPFSPARVRISQCRVFRLTRQEVRKRRITIRICIFLEASSEIVVGRKCWKYRGCATQSTGCARWLLPVCCNRGNFGGHRSVIGTIFNVAFSTLHSVLNVHRYRTTNDSYLIVTVFLLLTRSGSARKLIYFGCRECVSRRPLPLLHLVFHVWIHRPLSARTAQKRKKLHPTLLTGSGEGPIAKPMSPKGDLGRR